MTISTDRLSAFVALAIEVRTKTLEYRRTIDSRLRHTLPTLELAYDNELAWLAAELRAAAINAEAEVTAEATPPVRLFVEGGAA